MNITMTRNEKELTVALEGRLDTLTSPQLEEKLKPEFNNTDKLVFDFTQLKYISSAGLRIMLSSMQAMQSKGGMTVKNVSPEIMEIFEVTGFVDILNIE